MVSHAYAPSPCRSERHSSPFHVRLSLSLDEKKELCRTAKRLVRDVIDGYERFLWVDQERLSPARWATVREREDVRVLHDRRPGAGTEDRDLNVLLTVGTVVGSLHDAMYGVVAQTTEAMRLKTAYVQDTIRDCAVLATVQEPKAEKPFRSLTIKWLVKSVPLAARALTKHRDLVYMEATGTKRLSTGERVGFQLLHAVKFAQTPALPQYIRHGMSSCCLWRQQTPERVQVYMKSYLEVPERLLAPLVIRSAADALISLWRYMHCAQMKKLAWLVRRKSSTTPVTEEKAQHQHPFAAACCAVCDATMSSVRQAPAKAVCVVCARRVCDACRVQRELFSVSPGGRGPLTARRVAVCVPCLTLAVRADAADVARDEIPGAPPQLAALVRVVGTRSSCPVVSDSERRRELERHRERRSVSVSVSAGPPGSRKTSFANPLHSSGSSAGSSVGRGFQDRRAV